ncbi:hypothetical protein EJB05_02428 [Eragrostis curvula]|uniref:Uncharacterized protein n=1 Tax=Eragrostis curvula TaxID=38414 RepID=A0A5J9WT33_9POAL|nr:hypothetical protein EJB05_02428 [Eragrostis curvula]
MKSKRLWLPEAIEHTRWNAADELGYQELQAVGRWGRGTNRWRRREAVVARLQEYKEHIRLVLFRHPKTGRSQRRVEVKRVAGIFLNG